MSDLHCTYLDLEEEDFLNPETSESLIQEVLVGESISMLWSAGVGWLEGKITGFDSDTQLRCIDFVDGDIEEMDLKTSRRKWKIQGYKESHEL